MQLYRLYLNIIVEVQLSRVHRNVNGCVVLCMWWVGVQRIINKWKVNAQEPIQSNATSCSRHHTGQEYKQLRRHKVKQQAQVENQNLLGRVGKPETHIYFALTLVAQQCPVCWNCLHWSTCEPPQYKTNKMACVPSEDSDQADLCLQWMHSHFIGFVMRRLISLSKYLKHFLSRLTKLITMVTFERGTVFTRTKT